MTPIERVIQDASALVLPSKVDLSRIGGIARLAISKTKSVSRRFPEVKDVVLGGSYAKGTWLPERADIDIFLRMSTRISELEFERVGLSVGMKAMSGYPLGKKYAQHPYTEASIDGVKVNVVPCFAVKKGNWMSAADRSPFHVQLMKRLPERQKTEVRLLKSYMIGVGVYGAEIETQGFSGYVAEVLILQHKKFADVIRRFAAYPMDETNKRMTLRDPVDPARDLGVAISAEKLGRMILASREFLKKPRRAFFEGLKGKSRRRIRGRVVALVFDHARLSEDILWGELRKTNRHIVGHVESRGFRIARSLSASNNSDRSAFLYIPELSTLPQHEQRIGPSVGMKKETSRFLSGNKRRAKLAWVDDDGRLRIIQDRDYTRLEDLLRSVAKERVGSVGASRDLAVGMKRSGRILSGTELSSLASRTKWLERGLSEIASDTIGTS